MSVTQRQNPTAEVVEKVLRRAEIAKVARSLQDCLALATFKAQNGWQNRTLRAIEPEVHEQIRRKRPYSSGDILSDTSSTPSDYNDSRPYNSSSPLTGPFFSDELPSSDNNGYYRFKGDSQTSVHRTSSRKRVRSSSTAGPTAKPKKISWKTSHRLPQSSPVFQRPHTFNASHHPQNSFVSDAATIPDDSQSPIFHSHSEDDDNGVPMHSFQQTSSMISSSPPRTPPPNRARTKRDPTSKSAHNADGADLLLFLANSPSPANGAAARGSSRIPHPSTPPSQHDQLPSAMMNTPSGGGLFGGMNTPGQPFNFADFVNVTPSPAQLPWGGRTPGASKTPLAARAARRSLNFDALLPPNGSPSIGHMDRGAMGKESGLALALGDELGS